MKTHAYVDGFNLYYGALRGTGFKWLDIAEMCRLLLPGDDIGRIAYFTARVNGRPTDPEQPQRQQAYLRALREANPQGRFIRQSIPANIE